GCALANVAHAGILDWLPTGNVKVVQGDVGASKSPKKVTTGDVRLALKEALTLGTEAVVERLGQPDGFAADDLAHIALPNDLKMAEKLMATVGLGSIAQDVELRLNRAAEAALPEAKALFIQAIQDMTIEDAAKVLKGPSNSATRYFQLKMTPALTAKLTPLVDQSLNEVGAIAAYNMMKGGMNQWAQNPMINGIVPKLSTNLTTYTVQKTLDGTFARLAVEEADIRKNPARWTSNVLTRVFQKKKAF
ncbi:MAG: DUF4197 domain-containing protein, partial [Alphaproteobacteria bacterium]